ncbi:MAG: LytTR family DNA-binding domain-containing protein [Gemmatimonadaceae bacterium]
MSLPSISSEFRVVTKEDLETPPAESGLRLVETEEAQVPDDATATHTPASLMTELLAELRAQRRRTTRLAVKTGGRVLFLRAEEIDWVEAAGNYVRLHVGAESHLYRESMKNMEARLDGETFVRIHRSSIVNVDRIRELQPWFHGEYVVLLQDGTRLMASRVFSDRLDRLIA